jgi:hypothetical protein
MVEFRVFLNDIIILIDAGFVTEARRRLGNKVENILDDEIVMMDLSDDIKNIMARVSATNKGINNEG